VHIQEQISFYKIKETLLYEDSISPSGNIPVTGKSLKVNSRSVETVAEVVLMEKRANTLQNKKLGDCL
jgi:hypothetical protein